MFFTFWIVSCQNIQACSGNPCWEHRTDGSESSHETPWGQQCDVNDHTTVRCKTYLCAAQCKQQLQYYDVNEKPARDDVWMETQQGALGEQEAQCKGKFCTFQVEVKLNRGLTSEEINFKYCLGWCRREGTHQAIPNSSQGSVRAVVGLQLGLGAWDH